MIKIFIKEEIVNANEDKDNDVLIINNDTNFKTEKIDNDNDLTSTRKNPSSDLGSTKKAWKENSSLKGILISLMEKITGSLMSFACSAIPMTGQGIMVCFILLMFQCLMVSSSALPDPEYAPTGVQFWPSNHQVGLSSYLNGRGEESKTFTTYQTENIAIQTFDYRMNNFENDVLRDMKANCATITLWNTLCIDDEANCQLAKEEIQCVEFA